MLICFQSHHAAALYKKLGRMDEASQAYENDSMYGQAVELLVPVKLFDKAIDVVSRYHIKVQVGCSHQIVNKWFIVVVVIIYYLYRIKGSFHVKSTNTFLDPLRFF